MHAQAVLRLADELGPLLRIDLLVDVAQRPDQAARIDRVDRDVRAIRLPRQLAELAREVGVGELLALLLPACPGRIGRVGSAVLRCCACGCILRRASSFCANGELGSIRPSRASWNGLKS